MNLNQITEKAGIVSDKVFGKERPATGPVRKMVEEVEELLESLMLNEDPGEEFADVFLLLIDAYRKHYGDDIDMQKLIDDSDKKLDIIAKRVWGDPDQYGVFQHIKDEVESWDDGGVSTAIKLPEEEVEFPTDPPQEPVNDLETAKEIAKQHGEGLPMSDIQLAYDDTVVYLSFQLEGEVTNKVVKEAMEERLPSHLKVKCDDENNPPSVKERGEIWVRVSYNGQYVDLVF